MLIRGLFYIFVINMEHQGKVTVIDSVVIRQERAGDFNEIKHLLKESFAGSEYTDGDEHNLVGRIRATDEYIPSLSLVAEINNEIVGYAMFSQIYIGKVKAIALAPLAVLPKFQNLGIGKVLIAEGHRRAAELNFSCSVVLGYPDYYSKSGYRQASFFEIKAPFDVPPQFYMVFPFSSAVPQGTVRYSQAFD